ncbi:MAG: hypothetical protein JW795_03930 [Chitinivibrionales bacterium]|nr:hypothetical protein [Chitinivibrionales bacterium]
MFLKQMEDDQQIESTRHIPGARFLPSQQPPGGLSAQQVPMFVVFGFDDNGFSGLEHSSSAGGMRFVIDLFASHCNPSAAGNPKTYDGTDAHFSFYPEGCFIGSWRNESPVFLKRVWHEAVTRGHEIGNHTYSHDHGIPFSRQQWLDEMILCGEWLKKPYDSHEHIDSPDSATGVGVDVSQLCGFRTPFLEYNDELFFAAQQLGFLYDCSIEEGWQNDHDGSNFFWPYTLDNGSPGNRFQAAAGTVALVGSHPNLWEMPNYPLIVPPDHHCAAYGVQPGLRSRMAQCHSYFDVSQGKISGLDWNLWVDFHMTKEEFLATMRYSFDLRLKSNRCPFLFGAHSDIYADAYDTSLQTTPQQRREALAQFLDFVLKRPQVRVVTMLQVLEWMKEPSPLK